MESLNCDTCSKKFKTIDGLKKHKETHHIKLIIEDDDDVNDETIISFDKLSKPDLIKKCKELNIKNYSSKSKKELLEIINNVTNKKPLEQEPIANYVLPLPLMHESNAKGLKYIDLFCGIGGFHQALNKLNAECVLACDIDKSCREVYYENYKLMPVEDVKKINEKEMPDFDIICGGFPCFIEGTKVLTNNGYKNIEDVLLSDKLLTHTGTFQNILNLQRKIYSNQLYGIKIKYHSETISCTEEHPFYVREKTRKWNSMNKKYDYTYKEPEWKKANELTENDYYGMVINTNSIIPEFTFEIKINKNNSELKNIILNDKNMWYMMGYFIGDGWIEETKKSDGRTMNKIRFAINNKDAPEVLNKIRNVLKITDKKCDTGECKKYGCCDIIWYNILKQFGKYAHGKLIPEWVHDAPSEFIQEFICGYIKADGCVTKKNVIQITTVSYDLAHGLQRLYLKLGHIFSVKKQIREKKHIIEGRQVNQRDTYQISGKLNKIKKYSFIENNYVWFPLSSIKITETLNTPVYNFEVENDNSYIVENVIVHNCQPFSNGGKKKTFGDERGLLFDEIMRIAKEKNPRFMFLENVKHILKVSNGEVVEYIKEKIKNLGYKLQIFEISPHNYGIPQQRERVYFVCVRNDIYNGVDIELPIFNGEIQMSNYLDEKEKIDKKYFINGDILKVLDAWDEMVQKFEVGEKISPTIMINDAYRSYTEEDFNEFPDWKQDYITKNKPLLEKYKPEFDEWYQKHSDVLQKREIYGKLEWQTGVIQNNDSIFNHFIQVRQSGIRVKKSKYFPTLVAISQIPIYGKEKRYITPRECARLQSFPDSFILAKDDKHSYKQLGNSVNVDNVYTVISSTLKHYGLF
jgi:DNA (cytosine-5)-methyltransferase 1